jgi:hypothetical protein
MTFEEFDRGPKVLQDNMTVQGKMMDRLEINLNRLEIVVGENSEAIAGLADGMRSLKMWKEA